MPEPFVCQSRAHGVGHFLRELSSRDKGISGRAHEQTEDRLPAWTSVRRREHLRASRATLLSTMSSRTKATTPAAGLRAISERACLGERQRPDGTSGYQLRRLLHRQSCGEGVDGALAACSTEGAGCTAATTAAAKAAAAEMDAAAAEAGHDEREQHLAAERRSDDAPDQGLGEDGRADAGGAQDLPGEGGGATQAAQPVVSHEAREHQRRRSEPLCLRAPSHESEPESQSAPCGRSEPEWGSAPKNRSEPRGTESTITRERADMPEGTVHEERAMSVEQQRR